MIDQRNLYFNHFHKFRFPAITKYLIYYLIRELTSHESTAEPDIYTHTHTHADTLYFTLHLIVRLEFKQMKHILVNSEKRELVSSQPSTHPLHTKQQHQH